MNLAAPFSPFRCPAKSDLSWDGSAENGASISGRTGDLIRPGLTSEGPQFHTDLIVTRFRLADRTQNGRCEAAVARYLFEGAWPVKQLIAFVVLTLALAGSPDFLAAQNEAPPADAAQPATQKPYDTKPGSEKPPTPAEIKAEEDRKKALKADYELRARLAETVWNDLDLRAGDSGQVWMFRAPVRVGKKEVRDWFLNDDAKLPKVGSWEVQNGEILLFALDGTLMGRGTYADDEIVGRFVRPNKQEFGQFRLREETGRAYRVLSMRVIKRTLGK